MAQFEKVIIFPQEGDSIALMYALDTSIPIEEVARRDIAPGIPFKVIDASLIPEDIEFLNAFEADFTNPDGYGIGREAWNDEQEPEDETL